MSVTNAADKTKTVADPNAEYESIEPLWKRSRAVCSGERFVKDVDSYLDREGMRNLLIPFSPSMTDKQYQFFKAEAELPGIVAQFAKMLVGALLRKKPVLVLPDDIPEGTHDWIMNEFTQDNSSLVSFLDSGLWEEIQTSRAWVYVDYPQILEPEAMTKEEIDAFTPYPLLWKAESVINWHKDSDAQGNTRLAKVITRENVRRFTEQSEFHPVFIDTVYVHELDESGNYQVRIFERQDEKGSVPVVQGREYVTNSKDGKVEFRLTDTKTGFMDHGERVRMIPAWPLNGSLDVLEPVLSPIIDKEISLYNKVSRRNHLLYGASTYTPVVYSDMPDTEFDKIVSMGLGGWIKLRAEDNADILKTPTEALADYDRAIAASIEEMARLGIRMLSPETAQSGVALEIRNAAQTAQLGSLNNKISAIMGKVVTFMINWRYGTEYKDSDIAFSMSSDFNPIPIGADWLRLATEWYEGGLLPRSIWLEILKHNDLLSPDYNDEEGQKEINEDDLIDKGDVDEGDLFDNVTKPKPKPKPKPK